MSKIIRMTPEYLEQCRKDFDTYLKNLKLADGKISFSKTFAADKKRATLFFTAEAWVKMVMLINEFSKEVAWHGVAYRMENDQEKDEYIITDIMVYPQEVTGATVEMDTEKYATWLMENDEDERFYNIHMQGHSHVNMTPTPSGVDLNHQEEILAQLGDEDFYIFMIYNKSFRHNIKIYDLKKNTLFEDGDIDVKIHAASVGFEEFMQDAKEMVKEKTSRYAPVSTYGQFPQSNKPYNPLAQPSATPPVTPASGAKEKPKTQIGAGWMGANACDTGSQQSVWDDDDFYARYPYTGYNI